MTRLARVFYGPPDWIVAHTTARDRRAISFWLLAFWLMPGLPLWLLLRNAIWFVGFMSIFALWWTGLGAMNAGTPVEPERGS